MLTECEECGELFEKDVDEEECPYCGTSTSVIEEEYWFVEE